MSDTPTAKPRRLFDIGDDLRAWHDLLDEAGGEVDETGATAIDAWFAAIGDEQGEKLDRYVNLIRLIEAEIAAAKAAAEQYLTHVRVRQNRDKALKKRLLDYLAATGQTKVQTATGISLAIQKNGGKPGVVLEPGTRPYDFPAEFVKIVPARQEVDEDKIREALLAGTPIAHARLAEPGYHLRIR